MAYATVNDLREYLQQIEAGEAKDALLGRVLDRAHDVVDNYLRFSFGAWAEEATTRDVYCPHGRQWLEVPYYQAATVTTVESLSGRGTAGEATVAVTDWMEEPAIVQAPLLLYRDARWTPGWYRITAVWGYGPAPSSVVEVELRVAVNIWKGRDASQWQADLGAEGQGSVTYSRALTGSERSMLDAVRLRYLGVVFA